MRILVTGGAGFIGSALIRHLIQNTEHSVLNLDKLTYAANLDSLKAVDSSDRYQFVKADIAEKASLESIFNEYQPDAVIHLAAESHVDRSIDEPGVFIQTNINGTFHLLQVGLAYWNTLPENKKNRFRFLHVSTDEVYGSLGADGLFSEETSYAPNSPYAASKAASDHLVRSWFHTFQFPCLMTNCSNNYGPYHFPEKLIPLMILNAYHQKALPVYGDGLQVRDWLYVDDHARALTLVLEQGEPGEKYNIGGHNEKTNLEVVRTIAQTMNDLFPDRPDHYQLISHVTDRPGHDRRYAIDASKIQKTLGWTPEESFETGLRKTIQWYLNHSDWWQPILETKYQGQRLGVI